MEPNNMQAVIDAARKGVELKILEKSEHFQIIYSPTHGVQTVDLQKHNKAPARKVGSVVVFDAESLNRILVDNAVPGATTIYVNPDAEKPAIVAVINGNGSAGPGFGDFKASIGFRTTPQWAKWKAIDGKMLPQAEFAEFVEDNLADIATPDGATMMEIVTYFQATSSTDFRSGIKLSNGQVQLTNNENIEAQVGAGNIAVPDVFEIALAPVFGVAPFKVPARFRYRIENRRLKLGFKLQRVEDVMTQIIRDIEAEIVLPEGVAKVYGLAP
jgi:uncharacterized protein YfdQ (DUF2303 family)